MMRRRDETRSEDRRKKTEGTRKERGERGEREIGER